MILITYKTPGMFMVERSKKTSEQLKKLYGGKIVHYILDIREYTKRVRGGILQCLKDNAEYKFFYAWCLGCKLSMHLFTAAFCRKNDIRTVLDGSNYYDEHALEQHEDVKEIFKKIYKKNNIEYISPFYHEKGLTLSENRTRSILRNFSLFKDSTEFRVKHLESLGIKIGKGIMHQYRGIQPSCSTSLLFNCPRALLKLFFDEKKGRYLDYIRDKYSRELEHQHQKK
ncbi:MAG: hypothetical protein ABIA77_02980 [Candidatus Omnitrophota bacterium]